MTPRPAMLTPPQPQPVRHRYGAAALAGLALAAASLEAGAREVQYVESPDSDPDTIALGYPVPQPRAQAAPFAGFRDLAGIQARMAELALQPDGPRTPEGEISRRTSRISSRTRGSGMRLTWH